MKKFLVSMVIVSLLMSVVSFATEKLDNQITPAYVRSYWIFTHIPNNGPDVIFYEDPYGYRGYLSKVISPDMEIGGGPFGLSRYEGILYHPSVKNIPMPTRVGSNPAYLLGSSSKYVTKIVSYPYDSYKDLAEFPMTIFYDDGVYRGYISYTENLPVDKTKNRIYVTYTGTVYKGAYPAPFVKSDIK